MSIKVPNNFSRLAAQLAKSQPTNVSPSSFKKIRGRRTMAPTLTSKRTTQRLAGPELDGVRTRFESEKRPPLSMGSG